MVKVSSITVHTKCYLIIIIGPASISVLHILSFMRAAIRRRFVKCFTVRFNLSD